MWMRSFQASSVTRSTRSNVRSFFTRSFVTVGIERGQRVFWEFRYDVCAIKFASMNTKTSLLRRLEEHRQTIA